MANIIMDSQKHILIWYSAIYTILHTYYIRSLKICTDYGMRFSLAICNYSK